MASTVPSGQHHIRRVVLDIQLPGEKSAFLGRQHALSLFEGTLTPLLEQACDSLSPNGTVQTIDRLEVDLGRLDPDHLDTVDIERRVRRALELAWQEQAASPPAQSQASGLLATFFAFLEQGVLPWNAPVEDLASLEAALRRLPTPAGMVERESLLDLLDRPSVRLRLARQFDLEFITWLEDWLLPGQAARLQTLFPAVVSELTGETASLVRLAVLAWFGIHPEGSDSAFILATRQALADLPRASLEPENPSLPSSKPPQAETASDDGYTQKEADKQPLSSGQFWYVSSAGLVLLHPFLERFFSTLVLLDDSAHFTSPASQERAVHLLCYVGRGQQYPAEPETFLLKLLCGMRLDHPLPKFLDLNPTEMAESETLLQAVIQLWTKLGSTSPAGLREGFLQRPGRLEVVENGFRLAVEQHAIDLLLDALPWSLNPIHLPWMAQPLWVDWA